MDVAAVVPGSNAKRDRIGPVRVTFLFQTAMADTHIGSGARAWSDEEFLRAFENLSFPADQFHHREHLRVAWLYLKSSDATRASERMSAGIRRFANHHGATEKYHHTLTLFWMRLVAVALVETGEGSAFEEFLAAGTRGQESSFQVLFRAAPRSAGRTGGLGRTRPPAASEFTGLPLLLISSLLFWAQPAFRPRYIARTTFHFLP